MKKLIALLSSLSLVGTAGIAGIATVACSSQKYKTFDFSSISGDGDTTLDVYKNQLYSQVNQELGLPKGTITAGNNHHITVDMVVKLTFNVPTDGGAVTRKTDYFKVDEVISTLTTSGVSNLELAKITPVGLSNLVELKKLSMANINGQKIENMQKIMNESGLYYVMVKIGAESEFKNRSDQDVYKQLVAKGYTFGHTSDCMELSGLSFNHSLFNLSTTKGTDKMDFGLRINSEKTTDATDAIIDKITLLINDQIYNDTKKGDDPHYLSPDVVNNIVKVSAVGKPTISPTFIANSNLLPQLDGRWYFQIKIGKDQPSTVGVGDWEAFTNALKSGWGYNLDSDISDIVKYETVISYDSDQDTILSGFKRFAQSNTDGEKAGLGLKLEKLNIYSGGTFQKSEDIYKLIGEQIKKNVGSTFSPKNDAELINIIKNYFKIQLAWVPTKKDPSQTDWASVDDFKPQATTGSHKLWISIDFNSQDSNRGYLFKDKVVRELSSWLTNMGYDPYTMRSNKSTSLTSGGLVEYFIQTN